MKIVHDGSKRGCTEAVEDVITYTSEPSRITCEKCKEQRA